MPPAVLDQWVLRHKRTGCYLRSALGTITGVLNKAWRFSTAEQATEAGEYVACPADWAPVAVSYDLTNQQVEERV